MRLSYGLEIIENGDYDGVWGSTYYEASLFISRIFRACTYGERPIQIFQEVFSIRITKIVDYLLNLLGLEKMQIL